MFRNKQENQDFKKKRDQYAQQIRRNNRQELFSKKRNTIQNIQTGINSQNQKQHLLIVDSRFHTEIQKFLKMIYNINNLVQLVRNIQDPDIIKQHYGVIGIRKMLSIHNNPPIQQVIDAGLVPKFIEYIKQQQYPQLQLQATWALTNVASGTNIQCQSIIDKGGIPLFVQLLLKPVIGIVEQAIWAIGNISSDCTFYRDTILKEGGLVNLIKVTQDTNDRNILKHVGWAISNLCRGNPLPKYQQVKQSVPVLCQMVKSNIIDDLQVLSDVCWAISYNSEGHKQRIQRLINTGVLPKIIQYLSSVYMPVLVPSIRIIGNVSTGTAPQTDQVLKLGVLDRLQILLDSPKKVVRRQACWVLSNIAAGSRVQLEGIVYRQPMIKKLITLLQKDLSDIKKEICFIFSNMSYYGQPKTIFQLYQSTSLLKHFTTFLGGQDFKLIEVVLECLFHVLEVGQKLKINKQDHNPLVIQLMNLNTVDILQKLQYHKYEKIYQEVVKILTTFFQIQDPLLA